jgi:hypothetical protein
MTMIGHDTNGKPVKLGDTDSDGYRVGWIHPETGQAYVDEQEYWVCECDGRYCDAVHAARHSRDNVRPEPAMFAQMAPAPFRATVLAEILDNIEFLAYLRDAINGNAPTPRR